MTALRAPSFFFGNLPRINTDFTDQKKTGPMQSAEILPAPYA
jgi:hypothetical protein